MCIQIQHISTTRLHRPHFIAFVLVKCFIATNNASREQIFFCVMVMVFEVKCSVTLAYFILHTMNKKTYLLFQLYNFFSFFCIFLSVVSLYDHLKCYMHRHTDTLTNLLLISNGWNFNFQFCVCTFFNIV